MGLLQLSNHVVQNRHTGEQMTHWDMLNKENIQIWWLSLTCPSAFALQYGDFVPRDCSAAKGLLTQNKDITILTYLARRLLKACVQYLPTYDG